MGRELTYMLTSFLGAGGVSLHRNSPRPLILRDTQTHPEAGKAAHVSHIYVPSQILSPFPNPAT